jgi:hypothetical protein
MSERSSNVYKTLFEVRLLHHYWLDDGAMVFDLIAASEKKDRHLQDYDRRAFLSVAPTASTIKVLQGLGGIFKDTALGFIVAVPESAVLSDNALLEFIVKVLDNNFFHYTALTLRSQTIYEIYYKPDDKIYRYKENAPVFSNLTGATRIVGLSKALFLSQEIPQPAVSDSVESLLLSGAALVQLTSDPPGAGTQQLNPDANDLPVFAHQGDIPAIVPPAGMVGAPARGITLTDDIPRDAYALIRLSAVADDANFSFIDSGGHVITEHPVFQIRFKNRSTFWNYFDKATDKDTQVAVSYELNSLPLTYFGNASGSKQKPSLGLVKAEKNGARITKLVSEIFV